MILRRFTKHFTDQNWFAVGLDVLVVISGIFLGMQVTDWNENRKDNAEIVTIISHLLTDAETSHQHALNQLKNIKNRRTELEFILTYDKSLNDVSQLRDSISIGLFALSHLQSQYTTFDALKDSGWLSKLGRLDIVTSLNKIRISDEFTKRSEEDTERFQHGITDRFAMKNINIGVINGSGAITQDQERQLLNLLENQEFMNIVHFQLGIMRWQERFLNSIIEEYNNLIPLMAASN